VTDVPSPPVDAAAIARGCDRGELLLRRWAGTWLDMLALFIVSVVPIAAAAATSSDTAEVVVLVFVLVVVLGYYPVMESVWGRTLGKVASGTIVVDKDGRRPSIGQVLIRTALRLIEVNPFLLGGLPAGIAVLATERKQRLGDLAANTYVLPLKALRAAAPATPGPGYTPVMVD
jgi:uncharacterized RDD family membrane protein YckC